MKKNLWTITLLLLFLSMILVACGNDTEIQGEKSKAKTGEDVENVDEEEEASREEGDGEDIWTYYEDATWSDNYNGLEMEIQKIAVTNDMPAEDDEDDTQSAVGIKFKMENTTEDKFTVFINQSEIVTSTGEQIYGTDMWYSDHLDGDIDKGVIKEGDLIWYLERGEADKIEWVKINWEVWDDDELKEYEVELDLQ